MPPVMLVLLFFNCAVAAPATAPLPDPLVMNAGHKVETVQDRQARRGEMLEILQQWEYGHAPEVPEVSVTDVRGEDVLFEKSGKWGRRVTVTLSFHGLTMQAGYWKPRDAKAQLPAILTMEPVWWQDPFIKTASSSA